MVLALLIAVALFVLYLYNLRLQAERYRREEAKFQRAAVFLAQASYAAAVEIDRRWLGSLSHLARRGQPLTNRRERESWLQSVRGARRRCSGTAAAAYIDEALAVVQGCASTPANERRV